MQWLCEMAIKFDPKTMEVSTRLVGAQIRFGCLASFYREYEKQFFTKINCRIARLVSLSIFAANKIKQTLKEG